MMQFLEEAAVVMDTDQFVELLEMMAAQMEQMQQDDGSPGNGPPGHRFGRSGRGPGPGPDGTCPRGVDGRRGPRQGARFGQGGNRPGNGPRSQGMPGRGLLGEVLAELDLTVEQTEQIQQFLQEYRNNFDGPPADRAEAGQRRLEMREQMHAFLETILTPDQLAQLEELIEARRTERMEQRLERMQARLERHVEFLTNVLLLDESQAAQVTELATAAITAVRELHEGAGGDDFDPEAVREQVRQVHEETIASIRELLNQDQLRRFEALLGLLPAREI
jgi:Spy/CpxP family protein refolding chaperone